MFKKQRYIMAFILATMLSATLTSEAFACRCLGEDVNKLFDESNIVVLATPLQEFSNDKQQVSVQKIIKGNIPEQGLFINQQEGVCGYKQLPMPHEKETLLFISKSGDKYKLNSTCYNHNSDNGYFNLRMDNTYASIHKSMLSSFLHAKGKMPKISLLTSHRPNKKNVESWLSISNLEDKDIEIFHPSNRQAFTFFIVDNYGNIVAPQGYAKVDPKGGTLTIPAGGVYNYQIKPDSGLYFPYLSGTAQFGYALEENKKYRMHVLYRPYGGTYGATSSEEKNITIYD